MGRKAKNPIPVVATQITSDPNSVGVYFDAYADAQADFDPTAGYKTYWSGNGFTSLDDLSRTANQGLARMAAACLALLAQRQAGLRPEGTRYETRCDAKEAKELLSAVARSIPNLKKDGAYRAELANLEALASEAGVKLETFVKNNSIDMPASPFDLSVEYEIVEEEVEAEAAE